MKIETNHPPAPELDLAVLGEGSAATMAHVESCASCKEYIASVSAELAREEMPALPALTTRTPKSNATPIRRLMWIAAAALPAAAIVFFVLRTLTLKPGPVASAPPASTEPMRFKGGVTMTSIVDRNGAQERVSGDVRLGASQRMRLEVSLDRAGPVTVAFLGDDGSHLVLLAPTWLEPGTHLTEDALGFDRNGGSGTVVCGPPEAVLRAQETQDVSGLLSLRVRYAP